MAAPPPFGAGPDEIPLPEGMAPEPIPVPAVAVPTGPLPYNHKVNPTGGYDKGVKALSLTESTKPEMGSGSDKVPHSLVNRACRGHQKGGPGSRSSREVDLTKMTVHCSGRRPPFCTIQKNLCNPQEPRSPAT